MHAIRKPLGHANSIVRTMLAVAGTTIAVAAPAWADDAKTPDPNPPAADKKPKSALEEAADVVAADDESRGYTMQGEIVVSAKGGGVPLLYAGAREIIDSKALGEAPGSNVSDVLRRIPGVSVTQNTNNEAFLNVGSRGLSAQRSRYVVFLQDGLPTAMAPYGLNDKDLFPMTMERTDRIDFIRGGAALRYGAHAVGGVIDMISPPIPVEPTVVTRGRFGSGGAYSAMVQAGGTWGPWGVSLIDVEKGASDGFKERAGFSTGDSYARFRYSPTAEDSFLFTIGRYLMHAEQPGGMSEALYARDPEASQRPDDLSHGDSTWISGVWTHDGGPHSHVDISLLYHDLTSEVRVARPATLPFTDTLREHTDSTVFYGQGRFTWDTKICGMKNTFTHIVQFDHEDVTNDFTAQPLPSGPRTYDLYARFEGRGVALFNEDVVNITDSLQASVGYRLETIQMSSEDLRVGQGGAGRLEDYTVKLPAYGVAWTFAPRTALFADQQKSFRTPYYDYFDPSLAFSQGPIDPEQSKQKEIGIRTRDQWGFDATVTYFRTDFTEQLINVFVGGNSTFINGGEAASHGVEMSLAYDFAHLDPALKGLTAYITKTKQRMQLKTDPYDGLDAPLSPHDLGSWGIEYSMPSGVWVRVDGSSESKSFAQPENYEATLPDGTQGENPSHKVVDASIGWRQRTDGTGFEVSVGATNVFDEDYFYRSSRGIVAAPGRQFYATVGYTFRW